MLIHVRVDGAYVDVTLSQIKFLINVCDHLLFDFDDFLKISDCHSFFCSLFEEYAKIIIGHS